MELYIIRHGDPDYENDTLTMHGWEQAKELAQRMEALYPDRIYSSPLGRAKATAQPTCESLGKQYNIEEWTAESMDYMQYPDIADSKVLNTGWKANFSDGLYDFMDFSTVERSSFLDDMIKSSDEFLARHGYKRNGLLYRVNRPNDEKIALFCHGGFGGAWISHLLLLPPAMGRMLFALDTTSVTKFLFENTPNGVTFPRCIYLNDTSHLR